MDPESRVAIGAWLDEANRRAQRLLGTRAELTRRPDIFVYRDAEQLRSGACVSVDTTAYFDGAIHVYSGADAGPTIVHEYIHALLSQSTGRIPAWLEEGLAMEASQEDWWLAPGLGLVSWLRLQPLPFDALVDTLPGKEEDGAGALAYAQSAAMVRFIRHRRPDYDFASLLAAIDSKQITGAEVFPYAVGLSEEAIPQAWSAFLER